MKFERIATGIFACLAMGAMLYATACRDWGRRWEKAFGYHDGGPSPEAIGCDYDLVLADRDKLLRDERPTISGEIPGRDGKPLGSYQEIEFRQALLRASVALEIASRLSPAYTVSRDHADRRLWRVVIDPPRPLDPTP